MRSRFAKQSVWVYSQGNDEFMTLGGGKGKIKVSGFACPAMLFTQIGNDFAHLMGGGDGVIINNFFLGGYEMGKTTEILYHNEPSMVMTYRLMVVFGSDIPFYTIGSFTP